MGEQGSGRLVWCDCKCGSSRGNASEPPPAEVICKTAQAGNQTGCETEFGSESGNGVNPRFRIGFDPQEDRGKTGIDGTALVGP